MRLESDPHIFDEKLEVYGHNEPMPNDGWVAGCEHPSYADEDYVCAICGNLLTEEDEINFEDS